MCSVFCANEGVQLDITFSEQKHPTDTVAANPDGTPFRNADGSLLFRPGGHGALIENLNDLDADVVFVKTVDNVCPDRVERPTPSLTNRCLPVCSSACKPVLSPISKNSKRAM